MSKSTSKDDRIITPNHTPSCLYALTQRYLIGNDNIANIKSFVHVVLFFRYISFMGTHQGSLQPNCSLGMSNRPHPSKAIGYTLALSDLKTIITQAGHDSSQFTDHSNKRGGALAKSIGQKDRCCSLRMLRPSWLVLKKIYEKIVADVYTSVPLIGLPFHIVKPQHEAKFDVGKFCKFSTSF